MFRYKFFEAEGLPMFCLVHRAAHSNPGLEDLSQHLHMMKEGKMSWALSLWVCRWLKLMGF